MTLVSVFLLIISALLAAPVYLLFLEIIAALVALRERSFERPSERQLLGNVAVIVPAHNEGSGVCPTIDDIKQQLVEGDRLIVVADNCTDDTASAATAAGAEVIERHDLQKIGKGYALDWGIKHLSANPPQFVVFIDADCRIQSDMIPRLRAACGSVRRPLQACFQMIAAPDSPINHGFAEFAWIVKNWVRPLGLRSLEFPVQLMGTGMIFPWDIVRSLPLDSGNLVEDLKLGLDLAAKHKAAHFFPFVVGTSYFPISAKGTDSQRQRWETGHIRLILNSTPRMLFRAITRLNLDLLLLTLDMSVPPLSLLGILLVGTFVVTSLAALFGLSSAAMIISAANLSAFILAIMIAWLAFGRNALPARAFLAIGPYILAKVSLYFRIFSGKTPAEWIRTDRAKSK